ncbi:MAG: pantetheine-phosphate adenylyltransferase [Bacteroidetes bacterium]|jgi:pantetheine-phosphate adenylyltransferase|nr:pantetheine-phosphate adenylyltransferase [Bacteroidota bacterium]MBT5528598.1 pantetheine-phosphate adenylyltransferase [Cytophagia bacterium]MBT3800873.1 pantetheine-phosphate adenylyltransferase [Bacteroidota bacterium]MBT3934606.1 pantetheine-phosphate adenylyltransferase [Bacteroidota bacterium]MBT4340100.1 pantetheine-phosphate adenylyltransferase [Bacteroidota bacterium]
MKKQAIFPGSFDPLTLGHADIVKRSALLFDKIYVALGVNSSKPRFFPLDKSMQMIEATFQDFPNVEVIQYSGLTVELCRKMNVNYIVRGIRNVSDFEYERSLADMNRSMFPELETVFMDSKLAYLPISSTIVRDLIRNNADISAFVPKEILSFIS